MSFFVEKLGPAPGAAPRKENKSAAAADLLKNPSKAAAKAEQQKPSGRSQPERVKSGKVVVDRSPPKDDPPKKKKGWF
jgi:hypothetical protein